MAQVNVDLSEYDMLREAKKNAENEVVELKKEIEEYKKNARVIVTTKKCYRILDCHEVARKATEYYWRSISNTVGIINPYRAYVSMQDPEKAGEWEQKRKKETLEGAINRAVFESDNPDIYKPIGTTDCLDRIDSSTEIRGFEDVRLKVEEALKEEYKVELEGKLAEAKKAKEEYEEKYKEVKDRVKKDITAKYMLELEAQEHTINELTTQLELLRKGDDKRAKEYKELQEAFDKYKEDHSHSENYKASARSFELEVIRLKKELEDTQHELKVAKASCKKHWWSF